MLGTDAMKWYIDFTKKKIVKFVITQMQSRNNFTENSLFIKRSDMMTYTYKLEFDFTKNLSFPIFCLKWKGSIATDSTISIDCLVKLPRFFFVSIVSVREISFVMKTFISFQRHFLYSIVNSE